MSYESLRGGQGQLNVEDLAVLREEFQQVENTGWCFPLISEFHNLTQVQEYQIKTKLLDEGAIGQFYKSCYPDASVDELWQIAFTDARCLEQIGIARKYSSFDSESRCHGIDAKQIEQMSNGVALEDPEVDRMVMNPSRVGEYPVLMQRLENGMPRKLQLVYASTAMTTLLPGDTSRNREQAARSFEGIVDLWNLSDDEARFAIEQAARLRHKRDLLLDAALKSERVQDLCRDEQGGFAFELFGGDETVRGVAVKGFERLMNSFRYKETSFDDGLWDDVRRVVPPKDLERLYSYDERKQQVLDEYIHPYKWSYAPPEQAAEYLTRLEAATLMAIKIAEKGVVPDPGNGNSFKPTVSWVARDQGAPDELVQKLRNREIADEYKVLAECSDDTEVKAFVADQLAAAESVDPELIELLDRYRKCASDSAFHVYVDGHYYGDDPEEIRKYNEFYAEKNKRAYDLRATMAGLRSQIAAKFTQE